MDTAEDYHRGQTATHPFGGFRKRTETLPHWLGHVVWVMAHARDVAAILRGRLDLALREAVMAAVTEVNGCRFCAYVLVTQSKQGNLTADDVALMMEGIGDQKVEHITTATVYAQARAQDGFGTLPGALRARLVEVLGEQGADDVEVVARAMHTSNMAGNAIEALGARRHGVAVVTSRLTDDLVIAAITVPAILIATCFFAIAWRRSPLAIFRDLLAFVKSDEQSLAQPTT